MFRVVTHERTPSVIQSSQFVDYSVFWWGHAGNCGGEANEGLRWTTDSERGNISIKSLGTYNNKDIRVISSMT